MTDSDIQKIGEIVVKQVEPIKMQLTEQNKKLGSHDKRFDDHDKRFDRLEKQLKKTNRVLNRVARDVSYIARTFDEAIVDNHRRITRIEKHLAYLIHNRFSNSNF